MKTSYNLVLSAITVSLLTACGGSGSNSTSAVQDTYVAPDTETKPNFPIQVGIPQIINDDIQGSIITTEDGLSLYTFDLDELNVSNCEGDVAQSDSCLANWPPLLAADNAEPVAPFTLITRSTEEQQWALNGQPLYTYIGDTAQGDTFGDNAAEIWHLARTAPVQHNQENNVYTAQGIVLSSTAVGGELEATRLQKQDYSLYTFNLDPVGDRVCEEDCINAWPPVLADTAAVAQPPLSLVDLSNGQKQWAYKDKPLYLFVNDTQAGDTLGDNVINLWHLATTDPATQRTTEAGRYLSATGQVNVLTTDPENDNSLVIESQNKDGFALYTFDLDTENVSNCTDECITHWPAFLVSEGEEAFGHYSIVDRTDGSQQWAYKGAPLYFFAGDSANTDTTGDGIANIWHLVTETQLIEESNSLGNVLTVNGLVDTLVLDEDSNEYIAQKSDKTGFALYTFDFDEAGISNCTDASCIAAWPPLLATIADEATAPFSIITRNNGSKQWALNGMPLYFFSADETADDTLGEDAFNVWHAARPAPVKVEQHEDEGDLLVAHGNVLPSQGNTAEALSSLTLYTFDNDVADSGESTCFDSCAATWPPLYADNVSQGFGQYTVIERQENEGVTYQWAYQGLPLYFFAGDSVNGDTLGNYSGWPIARP